MPPPYGSLSSALAKRETWSMPGAKTPRVLAECPECGYVGEVVLFHVESREPAWPACWRCDLAMGPTEEHTTRAEHMAWCKQRALEALQLGPAPALASLQSDIRKHPSTRDDPDLIFLTHRVGPALVVARQDMRRWIEGFN